MALTTLSPLLLFLFLCFTTSIAKNQHDLKSMHFTLYQQDLYNKTDFMILNGIGGPAVTISTTPLGSAFVIKDPLTVSPNPSSNQLGTIEMLLVTHVKEGNQGITVCKLSLNMNGHKGSISISGVLDYKKASDIPVAGGTGDFLLVQGFVTVLPGIVIHGLDSALKYEFHLFWPKYGPLK